MKTKIQNVVVVFIVVVDDVTRTGSMSQVCCGSIVSVQVKFEFQSNLIFRSNLISSHGDNDSESIF